MGYGGGSKLTHDKVDLTALTDRTAVTGFIHISRKGTIETMGVGILTGSVPDQPGALLVHASLRRAGTEIGRLLGGYVYDGHDPSFPGVVRGSLDGRGRIRAVTGTDPAAGSEVSETVPTRACWRLVSLSVSCAVGAADITPTIVIDDGTNVQARTNLGTLTNGQTEEITAAPGLVARDAGGNVIEAPLPSDLMKLLAGWRIRFTGVTGDDNYAAPQIWVEEWLTG